MVIKNNKNTAELVGLSFGDGGLTKRGNSLRFQLCGSLNEDKNHYDTHIIPLFNKEVMIPLGKKNVGTIYSKNKGFYGISIQSKKLIELNKLGISIGPKKEMCIPK